jgi:arylsulfatase A-like enzyme
MASKPNIVVFFADDQRHNTIAALGNDEISTPNLDKLVESGTTFTHAHIPCGTSGAVCMPSRAMLHTGRTLFHLEGEGQSIPLDHTLLGETLQDAGYRTFGTGKWHNGPKAYARSFTDGGEIFFGGMQDHWNVPAHSFDPTGEYSSRTIKIDNCMLDNKENEFVSDHVVAGKHSSELFCEAAAEFIRNYDSESPFFTYVSFMAPHDPRSMPKRFLDMYDSAKITVPENFMSVHPIDYGQTEIRDELLAPYPRTPDVVREHLAEYYAMISHLDEQIGTVIAALAEKGELENTIILFAGDNGLAVGQHGLFGKQSTYEHSVRVPFIISGPGIPTNQRRDAYIYLLDIFPTLCDLIDISAPESVEGRSFATVIREPAEQTRETLYFAYTDKIRAVKDDRYKLIEYVHDGTVSTALYDLQDDPWELANLAASAANQHIVKRLRNEMFRLRDEWDDERHRLGKAFWEAYRSGRAS